MLPDSLKLIKNKTKKEYSMQKMTEKIVPLPVALNSAEPIFFYLLKEKL